MFSIFGNFSMLYECLTYSPFETRPGYYRNSPLIAYWIELRQCNEEIASFAKKTSSSSHAAGQESCYIHRLFLFHHSLTSPTIQTLSTKIKCLPDKHTTQDLIQHRASLHQTWKRGNSLLNYHTHSTPGNGSWP